MPVARLSEEVYRSAPGEPGVFCSASHPTQRAQDHQGPSHADIVTGALEHREVGSRLRLDLLAVG